MNDKINVCNRLPIFKKVHNQRDVEIDPWDVDFTPNSKMYFKIENDCGMKPITKLRISLPA